MSLNQDVQALKNIRLFSKIDPSKLKLLAFTSDRLTFPEGEDLCVEGDVGDAAYVIVSGQADVFVTTPDGVVKVGQLGSHEIVGEIAILCDVPRTATVRAVADLVALRISKESFFHLVTQFPQIGVEVMSDLASRLQTTTRELVEAKGQLAQAAASPDRSR